MHDVETLQALMRYNDWQHDPLSLGCPYNQIASRGDLAPTTGNNSFCTPQAFGAINAKLTTDEMVPRMEASVVGGPTHDTQPVFAWTPAVEQQFPATYHYGQPESFDFPWFLTSPPH